MLAFIAAFSVAAFLVYLWLRSRTRDESPPSTNDVNDSHRRFLEAHTPRSQAQREADHALRIENERRQLSTLAADPEVLRQVREASVGELPPVLRPVPPRPLERLHSRCLRHPDRGPPILALLRTGLAARALVLEHRESRDGDGVDVSVTYAWLDPNGSVICHTASDGYDPMHAASSHPGLDQIPQLRRGTVLSVVYDAQNPRSHILFESIPLDPPPPLTQEDLARLDLTGLTLDWSNRSETLCQAKLGPTALKFFFDLADGAAPRISVKWEGLETRPLTPGELRALASAIRAEPGFGKGSDHAVVAAIDRCLALS